MKIISHRYEAFGGILQLAAPSALVFVDKDYIRSLGYPPSHLWDEEYTGILSAPTEVHMAVTAKCSVGCPICYMNSHSGTPGEKSNDEELGLEGLMAVVDRLADMYIFHTALGGGESFEMPWIFELSSYVRSKGIVPNITTNGLLIDSHNARSCRVFGQINVSIDGVGSDFERAPGHFEKADRALSLLMKAGCNVGINCVVSRKNYDHLEELVRYAKRKGLREIEFLRFKPVGRGAKCHEDYALTPTQAENFFPMISTLTKKYRVRLKLDCSFTPMICYHSPDPKRMNFFTITGCDAGNLLAGIKPDGRATACSFDETGDRSVFEIAEKWSSPATFGDFRGWLNDAPEPCKTCDYLDICKGGCHVVARQVTGDFFSPDPECPLVVRQG